MNRFLAPIKHRDSYNAPIEQKIIDWFTEVIFGPIVEILYNAGVPSDRLNAGISSIVSALRTGKLWYADGAFVGKFSASVAGELRVLGAVFHAADHSFRIAQEDLPADVKIAVSDSIGRAAKLHADVEQTLDRMQENVSAAPLGLDFKSSVEKIVGDLQSQFSTTVKVLDLVTVPADVTPGIATALEKNFTTNLDLYIKKFAVEKIPELRKKVAANAFAGGRADRLAKIIVADYGVAKRKAAFLAGQETSLLVSKFREERYKEIGFTRYKWSTSHDERVRPDHKVLEGQTFFFDSPPVTDRATGARNNPGEDYNCRCVAIPIVEIETRAAGN